MKVRFDQFLVDNVDARRGDGPGDHVLFLFEEVVIMNVAVAGKGKYEGRLPAPAGAAAALRVVGGGWRHIAHVHDREVLDIDAELHGRRAEQDGKIAGIEASFARLTPIGGDLTGMLRGHESPQT